MLCGSWDCRPRPTKLLVWLHWTLSRHSPEVPSASTPAQEPQHLLRLTECCQFPQQRWSCSLTAPRSIVTTSQHAPRKLLACVDELPAGSCSPDCLQGSAFRHMQARKTPVEMTGCVLNLQVLQLEFHTRHAGGTFANSFAST
jgi:hypothetical protein